MGSGGRVTDGVRRVGRGVGSRVRRRAGAGGRHVGRRVAASRDRVRSVVRALPGPAAPATERWAFSVGALVGRHPRVPDGLAGPLALLDGLCSVTVGPDGIGFDGEEVPWEKVVRVRLRSGVVALAVHSLDVEIDRLRSRLPPVPGRVWLLARAAAGVKALLDLAHRRFARAPASGAAGVPCEIVYRGRFGRRRTIRASLVTTAFLSLRPDVTASIVATARQAGVAVAGPPRRGPRAGVDLAKRSGESPPDAPPPAGS